MTPRVGAAVGCVGALAAADAVGVAGPDEVGDADALADELGGAETGFGD